MIRPKLPQGLYAQDPLKALAFFLYALALWAVPSLLVCALLYSMRAGFSPLAATPLILLLMGIGGYGILLAGFVGHDGTHFSLHKNKIVSVVLGILATAPLVVIVEMGFALSHWRHHAHVGEEGDPDLEIFGRFKTFLGRAFLARPAACEAYARNAVLYCLGRGPSFKFPLPENQLRALTALNLVLNVVFLGLHLLLAWKLPLLEAGFLLVLTGGCTVSGLSPYVEHAGTYAEQGYDTRTATGLWWDLFLYGNNYHIEHHLYPNVPAYRLREAHEFLVREGYYDARRPLTRGFTDAYRFTLAKHSYAPVTGNPAESTEERVERKIKSLAPT